MRWETEKWRKLYRRVDAAWARLPVLARGLGSELLKYAEDDGRIPVREDEQTGEAVCCLMGARRSEWKVIETHVQTLLDDGYIIREAGAILIRNFERAQARSTGAERQARLRHRRKDEQDQENTDTDDARGAEREGVTSNATCNAVVTSPGDGPSDAVVTSHSHGSRSISLSSQVSGSFSSLSEEVPEIARTRDSESRASVTGQVSLPGVGEAGPAPALQPPVRRTRRGKAKPLAEERPLPADWQPTREHSAYAAEHGLDLGTEVFGFRGWAEGRTAVSWNGTFSTRLSNTVKWARERAAGGPQRPVQYGRGAPAPDRRQPGGMASGVDPDWETFDE